jgi:hypothetical protein
MRQLETVTSKLNGDAPLLPTCTVSTRCRASSRTRVGLSSNSAAHAGSARASNARASDSKRMGKDRLGLERREAGSDSRHPPRTDQDQNVTATWTTSLKSAPSPTSWPAGMRP